MEDTLKTEVERRKENVGKRVTKVKLLGGVQFHNKQTGRFSTVEKPTTYQTNQTWTGWQRGLFDSTTTTSSTPPTL